MKPVALTLAFNSMGISDAIILWNNLLGHISADTYTKQLLVWELRSFLIGHISADTYTKQLLVWELRSFLTDRNRQREKY